MYADIYSIYRIGMSTPTSGNNKENNMNDGTKVYATLVGFIVEYGAKRLEIVDRSVIETVKNKIFMAIYMDLLSNSESDGQRGGMRPNSTSSQQALRNAESALIRERRAREVAQARQALAQRNAANIARRLELDAQKRDVSRAMKVLLDQGERSAPGPGPRQAGQAEREAYQIKAGLAQAEEAYEDATDEKAKVAAQKAVVEARAAYLEKLSASRQGLQNIGEELFHARHGFGALGAPQRVVRHNLGQQGPQMETLGDLVVGRAFALGASIGKEEGLVAKGRRIAELGGKALVAQQEVVKIVNRMEELGRIDPGNRDVFLIDKILENADKPLMGGLAIPLVAPIAAEGLFILPVAKILWSYIKPVYAYGRGAIAHQFNSPEEAEKRRRRARFNEVATAQREIGQLTPLAEQQNVTAMDLIKLLQEHIRQIEEANINNRLRGFKRGNLKIAFTRQHELNQARRLEEIKSTFIPASIRKHVANPIYALKARYLQEDKYREAKEEERRSSINLLNLIKSQEFENLLNSADRIDDATLKSRFNLIIEDEKIRNPPMTRNNILKYLHSELNDGPVMGHNNTRKNKKTGKITNFFKPVNKTKGLAPVEENSNNNESNNNLYGSNANNNRKSTRKANNNNFYDVNDKKQKGGADDNIDKLIAAASATIHSAAKQNGWTDNEADIARLTTYSYLKASHLGDLDLEDDGTTPPTVGGGSQGEIVKEVMESIAEGNSPSKTKANAVAVAPSNEKKNAAILANSFSDTFAKLM